MYIDDLNKVPLTAAELLANNSSPLDVSRLQQFWWALRDPKRREDPTEYNLPPLPEYWSSSRFSYSYEDGPRFKQDGSKNDNMAHKSADFYVCANVKPTAVVGYISGWKGSPLNVDERRIIEKLRKSGFTVVAIALEHPETRVGSMESNIERVRRFVHDTDSPLYTQAPQHVPRFLLTHSTAGVIIEGNLLENALNHGPKPNLIKIYNTAPFFDISGAAAKINRHKNRAYTWHALRNFNALAGNPLPDRMLYAMRGLGYRLRFNNSETVPTHGQILEIAAYGNGHLSRLQNLAAEGTMPKIGIEREFHISMNDSFASPDAAIMIARLSGARIVICYADHNPMMNDRSLNPIIADMRQKSGAHWARMRAHGDHGILVPPSVSLEY